MDTSYKIKNDFYSQKNNRQISYRDHQELALITKFEADSNILKYELFLLPFLDSKTGLPEEEAIGFVVQRANKVSYVLVSDYLATRPKVVDQLKPRLCQKAGRGEITVLKKRAISQNLNVSRIK